MSNVNKIVLVGRVSTEIELRYTAEGSALAKFQLDVERPKKPDGDQKTDVISIVAWNKLAEICAEYLRNGRLILIDGRVQVRSYEANEGKRKYVTEIIAQNMKMLEGLSTQVESKPTTKPDQASPATKETVKKAESADVISVDEKNNEAETSNANPASDAAKAAEKTTATGDNKASETFYSEDDIPF